jgi:hypothetical protein
MLKELLDSLKPDKLLPKAFEKCGLVPLNRDKVLDRIPSVLQTQEVAHHMDAAVMKRLEVRRFGDTKKKPGGKKIPAGQSYSQDDENKDDEETETEAEEDDDSSLEDSREESDLSEEEQEILSGLGGGVGSRQRSCRTWRFPAEIWAPTSSQFTRRNGSWRRFPRTRPKWPKATHA